MLCFTRRLDTQCAIAMCGIYTYSVYSVRRVTIMYLVSMKGLVFDTNRDNKNCDLLHLLTVVLCINMNLHPNHTKERTEENY